MTAFEARDPPELRFTAKNIALLMTVIYLLTTLVFVFNVSWTDQALPNFYSQELVSIPASERSGTLRSNALPLIALLRAKFDFLPSFLNGCFIYSALSAANTGLYVASRALFGLTRTITVDASSGKLRRGLKRLSAIESRTKSPWPALAGSVVILFWLPFVHLNSGLTHEEVCLSCHAYSNVDPDRQCSFKKFLSTSAPLARFLFGARNV